MRVFSSRYTPGLKNGADVLFNKGETVHYKTRAGEEYDIIIDSDLMKNQNQEYLGYEAIFPDGRFFAVSEGIVGWEGKMNSSEELYNAFTHARV